MTGTFIRILGAACSAMLLLPLVVFLIHTIPACSCILLFRRMRIESMLIGMLLAEFLFVKFELGDQFFQIGTVLASIPSYVQFYKITGI